MSFLLANGNGEQEVDPMRVQLLIGNNADMKKQ